MLISLKQRKIKFKPRIKLSHNTYGLLRYCKSGTSSKLLFMIGFYVSNGEV